MCYMTKKEIIRRNITEVCVFLAIIGLCILMVFVMGCASATPRYDSAGNLIGVDGYGFLRDLEVEQVKPDGSKMSIKSKSTSADIMKAGNEILGTMTATAGKVF